MKVTSPRSGHRQQKKQRTKERLIEAALRLFIERGYEQTRIDDIVAEVDLVPRTFFRYFCAKDDALFGWYHAVRREAVASLQTRPRGEGIVRALIAAHLEVAQAHHTQHRIALVVHQLLRSSPEIRARQAAWLHDFHNDAVQVLASRLRRSDVLVAQAITAAVRAAFDLATDRWAADGASRPLQEYIETVADKMLKLFNDINKQYLLQ